MADASERSSTLLPTEPNGVEMMAKFFRALGDPARLRLLDNVPRPMRHNLPVTFHAHAMETPARVRLLDREALETLTADPALAHFYREGRYVQEG